MERTIVDYQGDSLQEKLRKILGDVEDDGGNCPIRNIMVRFNDKWSTLSIFHLGDAGTLRFNELKKRVDGISQRMLTVTLRTLERDGIVTRRVYPEIPPRVEYQLTDLGRSLLVQILALGEWANNNRDQIMESRARFDARESRVVEVVSLN